MASLVSRFLKGLTGQSDGGAKSPAKRGEGVAYQEFVIHPAPEREGGQWRVAGVIVKTGGDADQERSFTRADTVASREEAETLSVNKGKQIVDERGSSLFADGKATGRV